jgi:hypothetical protein
MVLEEKFHDTILFMAAGIREAILPNSMDSPLYLESWNDEVAYDVSGTELPVGHKFQYSLAR